VLPLLGDFKNSGIALLLDRGVSMAIRYTGERSTSQATEITLDKLPACEFHMENSGEYVPASFFGTTIFGTNTSMCTSCFDLYGTGLGPAGQILRLRD
jgi:hypothetical protein